MNEGEVTASPDESTPLDLEPTLVTVVDLLAIAVTGTVLVTGGSGTGGPFGVLVALAFVTFVPGWAALDWVPLGYGVSRLAVAVALSLTICTATAQALLWLGAWRPVLMLDALGALSLFALLTHLLVDERLLP